MAKAAAKPKGGGKAKKINGYTFPEHIPSGYIIKDMRKEDWCIHDTIGTGGFGEIYSASKLNDTTKINLMHPFAIKVEPKENGPLFSEMHFYMRVGKSEEIELWKQKMGYKIFGMPVLHGAGSFEFKSNNYRFIVTDRLGKSLLDLLKENGNKYPIKTALQIGIQVLNIIEYIHSKGYIHGDIKAGNLMLGMRPGTENTVYVIDFGLATKCATSDKELVPDKKKANNGTIEYISRDGHAGVFGFRGDLEILGFNLLHWIHGSLPWENDKDCAIVKKKKIELMENPSTYIKTHLPGISDEIINYLESINALKNNEVPNYGIYRGLLLKNLNTTKSVSPYGKLVFSSDKTPAKSPVKKPRTTKTSPKKVVNSNPGKIHNTRKRKQPVGKNDDCDDNDASSDEVVGASPQVENPKRILKRRSSVVNKVNKKNPIVKKVAGKSTDLELANVQPRKKPYRGKIKISESEDIENEDKESQNKATVSSNTSKASWRNAPQIVAIEKHKSKMNGNACCDSNEVVETSSQNDKPKRRLKRRSSVVHNVKKKYPTNKKAVKKSTEKELLNVQLKKRTNRGEKNIPVSEDNQNDSTCSESSNNSRASWRDAPKFIPNVAPQKKNKVK